MMKVVLCDSNTINSYGFRTDVNGIDLKRFKKNPVMLYNHNPLQVIGKWENIAVVETDGRPSQLTAEPVFDMDDPFAAEIARKVEDGFIKGCSMGLMITQITKTKGIDVATESVLLEASIVSIPADENALVVYADENKEKKLSVNEFNKLFYNMETNEKNTPTVEERLTQLSAQVEEKDAKIKELSATIDTLRRELAEREYRDAESFIDAAIADGKITEDVKTEALSIYLSLPKEAAKLFGAIKGNVDVESLRATTPSKATLSSMLKTAAPTTQTWDDLDRIPNALKNLKAVNPEEFRRLYREKFGSEPIA